MGRFSEKAINGIKDNRMLDIRYHARKIVATDVEVIDSILKTTKDYECDMIVKWTEEWFLPNNSI